MAYGPNRQEEPIIPQLLKNLEIKRHVLPPISEEKFLVVFTKPIISGTPHLRAMRELTFDRCGLGSDDPRPFFYVANHILRALPLNNSSLSRTPVSKRDGSDQVISHPLAFHIVLGLIEFQVGVLLDSIKIILVQES